MTTTTVPTQGAALNLTLSILKAFRAVEAEFPIQQAEVLLWVALRPGISSTEISDLTGLSQSSVSRNISALGVVHRRGKEGLDFISNEKDPRAPRRYIHFLTPAGRTFVANMLTKVHPDVRFEAPSYREFARGVFRQTAPA